MVKVEVYSRPMCFFCTRAKRLLDDKGVAFEEFNVWTCRQRARERERTERSGGDTRVPQIFIDGRHIGGCDQLYALERAGELDALLLGDISNSDADETDPSGRS